MSKLSYVRFNLFDFQAEEVAAKINQESRLYGWEMGTGKTYGGIATDVELRGRAYAAGDQSVKKTLIVCPKAVLPVWEDHLRELVPNAKVTVIDAKNRGKFEEAILDGRASGYYVCHYDSLRLMKALGKVTFFHIIADECHRIKNRNAQMTRAMKKIKTKYKTAMSGTPADNKPMDLWSTLNWLWPSYYTSYWKFVNAYCIMETDPVGGYRKFVGLDEINIKHLRKEMAPWYSRKLKKDVLRDLPAKYHSELWVDLDPKQRRAYQEMEKNMVSWCNEHADELEAGDPIIAQAVISQLIRLQQFALGYMYHKRDADGELMFKTVRKRDKETGEMLEEERPVYVMADPSSKLDALMEILEDNPDEQFVIFSQFKSILSLLAARLAQRNISHGLFTGDVKQEDRADLVRRFQAGHVRVFAGTVAAGGVGITLTAASTVIFLDRGWSPAINTQAEDRLHRIGQKSAVQVIDLMAKGTVDIARKQKIDQKMVWLQQVLGDKLASSVIEKLHFTEGEKGNG